MKSKVMDRPLFKGPAVPDDQVENVGIMQGFMDDEDDLMSMLGADDDEEMDEDENNQVMERSPRSPEILMNNLRGDMRSMDARVEELADLVGYNAAQETPEEVLMLLQPILAQQGIGGLPPAGATGAPAAMPPQGMPPEMGGAPTMPPEMGMPPAMEPAAPGAAGIEALMAPQAAPPTDQAPIQMAEGGYVQRFQAGSDEEGVTPVTTYPPELVKYAQEQLMAQRGAGNLRQSVEEVLPVYREILGGGDRRTMQGQALMDIAQAGLRLASGRNAQGANIAGGSFASQLASAAQGLPGKLAERAGQFQQEERAIKLAALKSAESSVEGQRKLFSQIVKSAGQSPFGKGDWDYAVFNTPELMQRWSEGKTDEKEDMLVESAITKRQAPRIEYKTNPDTGFLEPIQVQGSLPPYVAAAVAKRKGAGPVTTGGTTTGGTTTGGTTTGTTTTTQPILTADKIVAVPETVTPVDRTLGTVPGATPPAGTPSALQTPQVQEKPPIVFEQNTPTLYNSAALGSGVVIPLAWARSKVVIGDLFPESLDESIQRNQYLKLSVFGLNRSLASSPRFVEGERIQLQKAINLDPEIFTRPEALQQRIIGMDDVLLQIRRNAVNTLKNAGKVTVDMRQQALDKVQEIDNARMILGVPPRAYTQAEVAELPSGTRFLWQGKRLMDRD
jgi:hypothetical protein